MIYTLTFNPALDYVIKTDDFCVGKEHRTDNGSFFCGVESKPILLNSKAAFHA